jgi:nitrate/TMAO reductase-like tetraheme cytochrome c subunit
VAKNVRSARNQNPPAETTEQAAARVASRNRAILLTAGIVLAVGLIVFFPAALLTDRPVFCKSCHTMVPFYDAWQQGPHKDVWCIDCHVDAGLPRRFEHKFVALSEVYAEFFKKPTFPSYNADVPDARCLRCHPDVPTQTSTPTSKFSHVAHLNKGVACAKCHASTGHKVTFASLDAAGILNRANAPAGLTFVGEEVRASQGKPSALPGHKPVPCSDCHDQANLQCSFCHATPANHYGADCKSCHTPTVPFANFVHPPSGEHDYRSRPCAACHPNGYQTAYCTCHKGNPPRGD